MKQGVTIEANCQIQQFLTKQTVFFKIFFEIFFYCLKQQVNEFEFYANENNVSIDNNAHFQQIKANIIQERILSKLLKIFLVLFETFSVKWSSLWP